MSEHGQPRQISSATYGLVAAMAGLLLTYTSWRASVLSFTHDESLSFLFHVSRSYSSILLQADTANNHLLNTLLMKLCGSFFGPSELALRLPNLAAHAVYMSCSVMWLRSFGRPMVLVVGFLALNVNPYLLDFFSLARGYGIAAAALMASIACMTRALASSSLPVQTLSLVAAAVAVLANYTLLNFLVALIGVFNVAALGRSGEREPGRSLGSFLLAQNLPAAIVSAALAALVFTPLAQLRLRDQLYYGGTGGFWQDTVMSLLGRASYAPGDASGALAGFGTLAVVLLLGAAASVIAMRLRDSWARALTSPLLAAALLLLISSFSTVVQYHWLGTPYLIGRTGLFLLPLLAVLAVCLWCALRNERVRRMADGLALGLTLAAVVHALASLNASSVLDWRYDAATAEVVDSLEERRAGGRTRVGVNWHFGPAMFFYRETRELDWLWISENADTHHSKIDRRGFGSPMHYYYVLDEDLDSIEHGHSVVRRFEETEIGTPTFYRAN